ncbi:MAG: zinc ribbon domain-containing protein [Acidobacteriaceae bacterium]
MPLYEYQCKQCQHRFEKIQSFSAPEERVCPECGGEVERLISAPAIQFKGAGWYVNDYAGRNKAPSSSGSDSSKDSGSREGGAKESGGSKDVSAKNSESSSKSDGSRSEGGKRDSGSKSDSGTASSSSGGNAVSSSTSGSGGKPSS